MTDVVGNPEEERRADFFHLPWSQEAVCRYFYGKVTIANYVGNVHILPQTKLFSTLLRGGVKRPQHRLSTNERLTRA